jgi:hypothetical protein
MAPVAMQTTKAVGRTSLISLAIAGLGSAIGSITQECRRPAKKRLVVTSGAFLVGTLEIFQRDLGQSFLELTHLGTQPLSNHPLVRPTG